MGDGPNQLANGSQNFFENNGRHNKREDKVHQNGDYGDAAQSLGFGLIFLAGFGDVLNVDRLEAFAQIENREKPLADLLVQDNPGARFATRVKRNDFFASIDVLRVFSGDLFQDLLLNQRRG